MSGTALMLLHKCYLVLILLSDLLGIHFILGILFCGAWLPAKVDDDLGHLCYSH